MCIILACMHSSIDIMQDRLDFSSIYVIRQLLQLYASRTVHSSKKNASQYILPLLDDFVGNHWANHRCLKWKNVTKAIFCSIDDATYLPEKWESRYHRVVCDRKMFVAFWQQKLSGKIFLSLHLAQNRINLISFDRIRSCHQKYCLLRAKKQG